VFKGLNHLNRNDYMPANDSATSVAGVKRSFSGLCSLEDISVLFFCTVCIRLNKYVKI